MTSRPLIYLLISFLLGCAESGSLPHYSQGELSTDLVGGKVTSLKDPLTQSNLLLWSKWKSQKLNPKTLHPHCTATALNRFTLITAAHCVFPVNSEKEFYVQAIDSKGKKQLVKVLNTQTHPDYQNQIDIKADLAVLVLEKPLPTFIRHATIPLPSQDLQLTNKKVVVGGYGKEISTRAPRNKPARLKHILRRVSEYSKDSNYFLMDQSDGQGVCNGDSGALAYAIIKGKNYGLGLVSRTLHSVAHIPEDGSVCDGQIVMVNLQHYKSWIYKTASELIKQYHL